MGKPLFQLRNNFTSSSPPNFCEDASNPYYSTCNRFYIFFYPHFGPFNSVDGFPEIEYFDTTIGDDINVSRQQSRELPKMSITKRNIDTTNCIHTLTPKVRYL